MFNGSTPAPYITWIPSITCTTLGDLAITYSIQSGYLVVHGRQVILNFRISTNTFTYTSASGNLIINGVPIPSANNGLYWMGTMQWGGITKANFTQISPRISPGGNTITLIASGGGQFATAVAITDLPTAGAVSFIGTIIYLI